MQRPRPSKLRHVKPRLQPENAAGFTYRSSSGRSRLTVHMTGAQGARPPQFRVCGGWGCGELSAVRSVVTGLNSWSFQLTYLDFFA
jgi:hypothetical protein